jgi:hypothetical protein
MKAKGLVCLVAAVTLLASVGVVCAYDESGTTTTFGAGTATTLENYSTIVGYAAGNGDSSTGIGFNTFIGSNAGNINTSGGFNTFLGQSAGAHNTTGDYNSFVGVSAGASNTTGDYNTFIGGFAGQNNSIGSRNVFLGYTAGLDETGSNKLYIHNGSGGSTNPFIYGEFDTRLLKVDGSLGVGTTPVRQLHVAGSNAVFRMDRTVDTASFMLVRTDVGGNPMKTFVVGTNASGANTGEFVINDLGTEVAGPGTRRMTITNNGAIEFTGIVSAPAVIETSSLTFKTNVQTYENALDTVNRLRGVRFDWKETGKPSVGLIAEEVDRVIPEVVSHEGGAAKGVNYSSLVGVLVEAVKEQQKVVQQQQTELDSLKELKAEAQRQREDIAQLKAEINRLKSKDMIAQR